MSVFDIVSHQLVNGLVLGSFYALVALGYTMIFGVIKLLNFAHGDLYMVGRLRRVPVPVGHLQRGGRQTGPASSSPCSCR